MNQRYLQFMLDLIPALTFLILNGLIAAFLALRWDPWGEGLTQRSFALTWALSPFVYGLGTLLFLLGGQWHSGLAIGEIGTLAVPTTLALFLLSRPGLRLFAVSLALGTWFMLWVPSFILSEEWVAVHHCLLIYLSLMTLLASFGLWERSRSGVLTEVHKRVFLIGMPFFLIGILYLLVQGKLAEKVVFCGSINVCSEILLLSLFGARARRRSSFPFLTVVLQGFLLATGAFLLTLFAANLGFFPKAPGPMIVSTVVATALSVATGLGRRPLDLLIKNTLYPEAARASQRMLDLEAELQATRNRLRQAEHSSVVAQLAAQVAHEIKNPLGPIIGYTKVIERELEKTDALSELIQRGIAIIRQEVQSIDAHAQGLLQLARPPELRLETLDFVSLGQDVIDLVESDAPGNILVTWGHHPESAFGTGDPVILRGAVLNIVQNSIQAISSGGGAVQISIEKNEGRWRMFIDDDGPGFPGDDPELLFLPFISHQKGGTGLGLVIARGALRNSGGELKLMRRKEGGTRALLDLPGLDKGALGEGELQIELGEVS
ncbi:MAG: HAMP domain-containing sensor histidine kinase [Planctomycetota bacterium]|nr:HAMP domain-containing sensor histidine kinase [Planctomycetota bacterium]